MKTNDFLFGAAYYEEYMPYERTEKDFKLMKEAGMNVIRIAESTWSTWEPSDGVFDFSHLKNMLECAEKYDLKVIIGTPTYAIPSWLAKKYPDIMAYGKNGHELYGHRQLFDITNPDYLRYAERIIRKLMEVVKDSPQVIGYQLDNETRSAGAASEATQKLFVKKLMKKYPDIEEFNREFGLDYWSNRISSWEDFPDIRGTINGSLSAAYKRFLRDCITDFLTWQAGIVREYMREGQFITHNFDYSWCGYSVGIQPEVDQHSAAKCMDIAGCDIYHRMQDYLDGSTITFGGAVARSLKKDNYLVLETEAQGNVEWLAYPGQLRLSAYSHIANGASSVMYWNWHSIHNAIESYWKGVLSHDLTPHATYEEIKNFRHEHIPIEAKIKNLKKKPSVGILVDNASLTGLDEFPISEELNYNAILRWFADSCHEMNIEYDLLYKEDILSKNIRLGSDDASDSENDTLGNSYLSKYKLLIVPALYSASDDVLLCIKDYVRSGGHLLLGFKSAFSDDELKIYHDAQPHLLTDCIGATYDMFTIPKNVNIKFTLDKFNAENIYPAKEWIELVTPTTADVWAYYNHQFWGDYAAITHNSYGEGTATYIGCYTEKKALRAVLTKLCPIADIPMTSLCLPIIKKTGINEAGKCITFYFNYSSDVQSFTYDGSGGTELLRSTPIEYGETVTLRPWDLIIVETK
ncbi:MAG: beta-galactosidase [Lachnospiraceae bacterium]|nr:beta-galactosidase [Lachnospiraceae bacterium]